MYLFNGIAGRSGKSRSAVNRFRCLLDHSNRLLLLRLFFCQSFEVNAPGLSLAFAFGTAACIATVCAGFDMAFGYFIPPFLLCSSPNLFLAADTALKPEVGIKAAFNKRGDAVTVIGCERRRITGCRTCKHFYRRLMAVGNSNPLSAFGAAFFDLRAALFAALHRA